MKNDLGERKAKIEKYEKLIKKLVETSKNPWTPCPLYTYTDEEEKIEKILEEIPQNVVQVHIESCNYDKDDAYVYVSLVLTETKTLAEWVYLKEFPKKLNWKLEKNEHSYLHRKSLEISLYRTHWYWPFRPSLKGSFKVKLETLKSKCELQNNFDMEIASGRISPQFKIAVSLRSPIIDKEYTTIPKQVIQITKAYPEFNKDGIPKDINNEFEEKPKTGVLTDADLNANQKTLNQKGNKEIADKNNTNKNNNPEKKNENTDKDNTQKMAEVEKIDASEFSKEDLEDPDNQDNLLSLKYMEYTIDLLDKQIKKIEGRPPQKLRQKFLQTKCRYNTMKEQVIEGAITIDSYIGILNKQIQKDKRLAQYLNQNGIKDKAGIVFERLKIQVKELEEAMTHLKK